MATLLVSGDSWTSGWPLEERLGHRNYSWPALVSSYFDFDLIDKSRAGSSNYRIFRKAFDGISTDVDIALVFLTSWTRFETGATFGHKPGRIYQHLPQDSNPSSKLAFKLFFNGYLNYTNLLRQIISLQYLAKRSNTDCFFLDTFDQNLFADISLDKFKDILKYNIAVFDNINDQQIVEKYKIVKLLESKVDWTTFISLQSYQTLINGCKFDQGHPVEDGHKKIAEIVIHFLESKNYGKTI